MGTKGERWQPPGGNNRYIRQFLHYWRQPWTDSLSAIIDGRQKKHVWRREYSKERWFRRTGERIKPAYKPPATPEAEHETMMQLFLLTGRHGMDNELSWLCQYMRKIGAESGC